MRILFLTPEFVTEKYFDGGLANYIYRISKELIKEHSVEVIVSSDRTEKLTHEGIVVHRVGLSKLDRFWMMIINMLSRHKLAPTFNYLFYAKRINKYYVKLGHFDVLQSSNYGYPGYFVFKKEQNKGILKIVRASSYAPAWRAATGDGNSLDSMLNNYLEVSLMRMAEKCYSPSRFVQELFRVNECVNLDIIRTPLVQELPEMDENVYESKLKSIGKYLLYFGTISMSKGLDQLAEVLPGLIDKYPDIKLVFVGKDTVSPSGDSMLPYIKEAVPNIGQQLIHLGKLKHSELYPIIMHAHGLIFLSRVDNIPNACLEAISMKKAILAPKGASFDEMLSNENSILFEFNNMEDLMAKMEQLWTLSESDKERLLSNLDGHNDEYKMESVMNVLSPYFVTRG